MSYDRVAINLVDSHCEAYKAGGSVLRHHQGHRRCVFAKQRSRYVADLQQSGLACGLETGKNCSSLGEQASFQLLNSHTGLTRGMMMK